jgi:Fe-S cluster assembly protein SufD
MTSANGTLLDVPTTREEAWRYTPVEDIVARMQAATAPVATGPVVTTAAATAALTRRRVDALAGSHGGPRLVFVNGAYDAGLSDPVPAPPGLRCGVATPADIAALEQREAEVGDNWFRACNRAARHDVAIAIVEPGAQIDQPVHIVHLSAPCPAPVGSGDALSHPRTFIDVGDGGRVAVIETYCGLEVPTVTNASTTVRAGRHAEVDLCRIQTEPSSALHVGDTRIEQAEGARLRMTAVSVGADIARNAISVRMAGAGTTTDLSGVDLAIGRQRHDTVVTVDHLADRGASTQRFTGVVNDHGRASFSGEIIVRPGTRATDAHQSSRNLVLGPNAEADARPWLQILADDVRCTHGATVGRLDDDALFYLRSRGIGLAVARTMLIEAFVRDITDRIPHESLRRQVGALVTAAGPIDATATEPAP